MIAKEDLTKILQINLVKHIYCYVGWIMQRREIRMVYCRLWAMLWKILGCNVVKLEKKMKID